VVTVDVARLSRHGMPATDTVRGRSHAAVPAAPSTSARTHGFCPGRSPRPPGGADLGWKRAAVREATALEERRPHRARRHRGDHDAGADKLVAEALPENVQRRLRRRVNGLHGNPDAPATEDTFTTWPRPRSTMPGRRVRVRLDRPEEVDLNNPLGVGRLDGEEGSRPPDPRVVHQHVHPSVGSQRLLRASADLVQMSEVGHDRHGPLEPHRRIMPDPSVAVRGRGRGPGYINDS
jgi:hypothetical protein